MADATLNTDLSRRSIRAVAVSASRLAPHPATTVGGAAPSDAPPVTSPLPVTSPSDAALLRRIAAAEAAWRALGQADVRRKALCAGTSCFDELPDKRAYLAAQAASRRAESRFRAACTDAYRDPAHSLRGLQARLALALRLTQEHDLLDHPPYDWLEAVLAELTHLTGHPTQASVLGASRQSIFQPATREVTA